MIPDSELGELLAGADTPDEAVRGIVSLAVRRGGPDNATAVIVFVDEF
jgi:protein phosphatase